MTAVWATLLHVTVSVEMLGPCVLAFSAGSTPQVAPDSGPACPAYFGPLDCAEAFEATPNSASPASAPASLVMDRRGVWRNAREEEMFRATIFVADPPSSDRSVT